jgi:hypothetical protein
MEAAIFFETFLTVYQNYMASGNFNTFVSIGLVVLT